MAEEKKKKAPDISIDLGLEVSSRVWEICWIP
jgi:hypothetical protein